MNISFTNLGLEEEEEEDPKMYVTKLEHVNELFKSIDDKYKKDDLPMITQVVCLRSCQVLMRRRLLQENYWGLRTQPSKKSRRNYMIIGSNISKRRRQKELQIKHLQLKAAKESLHSRNNSKGIVRIVENKDTRLEIVGVRKEKMVETTITIKEETIEEVET
jgi:hypothetical protein